MKCQTCKWFRLPPSIWGIFYIASRPFFLHEAVKVGQRLPKSYTDIIKVWGWTSWADLQEQFKVKECCRMQYSWICILPPFDLARSSQSYRKRRLKACTMPRPVGTALVETPRPFAQSLQGKSSTVVHAVVRVANDPQPLVLFRDTIVNMKDMVKKPDWGGAINAENLSHNPHALPVICNFDWGLPFSSVGTKSYAAVKYLLVVMNIFSCVRIRNLMWCALSSLYFARRFSFSRSILNRADKCFECP